MPFDPTLPVNNSLISSSELRNQLNGLKSLIDNLQTELNNQVSNLQDELNTTASNLELELNNGIATTALNPAVDVLSQSISNPPTQAQVLAIQNKLNELINAITRPVA